jgi:acyl-CoA thioester hydrolase
MTTHTRFRVRYAETDQMGIVHHANYYVWMEMGRSDYCRATGIRYSDMEEQDGVMLAVAQAECRYVFPAHYDEELIVETTITKAHARLVEFGYRILRAEDSRLLAHGATTHVFCDRNMQRRKLPEKYWEVFGIGHPSVSR